MSSFFIISIMTDDRPGIVDTLSGLVKDHSGNWLESRMTQLAGKFAGIVKIQINEANIEELQAELNKLKSTGWVINTELSNPTAEDATANAKISIIGNDRPGIVKDVAKALSSLAVNVLELNTQFESAAMSAEPLFKTKARVHIPTNVDFDDVRDALEQLSNELMVEINQL
ncbi:glycine cleavage system protein R [Oceaniserpentilla sp. 4NH20-0058]|uniref:glycine cleavage system protein R n=1 Tax=Oceaniserpentilla sp. 4NH20-0058 TaxID=3127660 RepID=UPI003101FB5A